MVELQESTEKKIDKNDIYKIKIVHFLLGKYRKFLYWKETVNILHSSSLIYNCQNCFTKVKLALS